MYETPEDGLLDFLDFKSAPVFFSRSPLVPKAVSAKLYHYTCLIKGLIVDVSKVAISPQKFQHIL
jgi:hypothetical protein